jgi:DNA-binding response OmpR family regulator
MKLLIIEDDKSMALTLKESLKNDFLIDLSFTGEDGVSNAAINSYDLIILDYTLPNINGLTVIKEIKKNKECPPIIVLTGNDALDLKVLMLDSGSDDYLVKPIHIQELKARIRVLLRRSQQQQVSNVFVLGDLTVDFTKKKVLRENKEIFLRRKEFNLLEYFIRNSGKVLTRSMILDHVWDSSYDSFANTIDVHVSYLREKLDKPFSTKLIKTVHGVGYKLDYERG